MDVSRENERSAGAAVERLSTSHPGRSLRRLRCLRPAGRAESPDLPELARTRL